MNEEFDAVVIGAGVIGCSVALELARKGLRTVAVDKLADAGAGSSGASELLLRTGEGPHGQR